MTTPTPSSLLAAGRLIRDPRVAKARQLLLEAVSEHQEAIKGIRPPLAELKTSYDQTMTAFNEWRGGQLWFPFLGSGLGKGALVELLDGSVKYDFISGLGPHYLGHSHPALLTAGLDAAISDTIM